MAINLKVPETKELRPRITVLGVGGAGGNAVNNMIEAGLEGVEFVVANTDAQQLQFAKTDRRIQLGVTVTPSWIRRSVLANCSCWASVLATTNSTPSSPASIMLLTALPPAPPIPNTTIRGFSSVALGAEREIAIAPSILPKYGPNVGDPHARRTPLRMGLFGDRHP